MVNWEKKKRKDSMEMIAIIISKFSQKTIKIVLVCLVHRYLYHWRISPDNRIYRQNAIKFEKPFPKILSLYLEYLLDKREKNKKKKTGGDFDMICCEHENFGGLSCQAKGNVIEGSWNRCWTSAIIINSDKKKKIQSKRISLVNSCLRIIMFEDNWGGEWKMLMRKTEYSSLLLLFYKEHLAYPCTQ